MKNSFAFYQGASPGMSNFGARLAAAAGRRGADEMAGMKDAAHMDLYEQQAELARQNATAKTRQNDTLAPDNEAAALSALSGVWEPLAGKAMELWRTGKVNYKPLTPNDDDGNPMPVAESNGAPPELVPHLPQLNRARQTLWATRAGGGHADNIAKAAGDFQGQQIVDDVQKIIEGTGAKGADLANMRLKGAKPGGNIKRYENGAGGSTFNIATGESTPGAANNKAVADLRAAMTAAGIDPDSPAAKELYKQLAVKMVTHPGITPEKAPQGYRLQADGSLAPIAGGPADARSGELADKADERKRQRLDTEVTKLSTMLEKSNAPTFEAILGDIENTVKGLKDIPGFGTTGFVPNFLLSDAGKELRRKVASLRNIELKDRSGAAVTDQELRRFLEELGTGLFQTDKDLLDALKNVRTRFEPVKQNIAAGFGDDVLGEYSNRGGMRLERGPGARPPAPAGAPAAPAAPRTTPQSGGRPPLSSFEGGGGGGAPARAMPTSAPPGRGQAPKSDRIAILQDEYERESAYQPKDQADVFRKKVNLESLARELRGLGVIVGGT